jgi:predicted nucleic-acid-binding Zn-ribbon protein
MICPNCSNTEIVTDYEPRAIIASTLPQEQRYIRHTCNTCGYEFMSKSRGDDAGEILRK